MNQKIPVTRSSMPPFEEYVEEIRGMWDNRWLSNRGACHQALEEQLKTYLGVPNVALFANGHVALEVALQTLELSGEVITTPFTHISTSHSIVRNGLTPVFCDILPEDLTIDPSKIEALITEKTCAIVATHVYGYLCHVSEIEAIAKKYGLQVVYDAAHAFGETLNGVGVGNFGDAAMFSTHATKVFHTIEGGIITYQDSEKFCAINSITNFGFTGKDTIGYIGTNARMNEFEAAMGTCNLRHLDQEIAKRKLVYERYTERLSGVSGLRLIQPQPGVIYNYAYYPMIFDGYRYNREQCLSLLAEHDIIARRYFYPAVNQAECYKDRYALPRTPIAQFYAEHVLTLPLYADMTPQDADRVCDVILKS